MNVNNINNYVFEADVVIVSIIVIVTVIVIVIVIVIVRVIGNIISLPLLSHYYYLKCIT